MYTAPEVKEHVRGISKLTEECGEVLQLLGKLNVFPGGDHPDGKGDLYKRIADELDDLQAAITFFRMANEVKPDDDRIRRKYDLFKEWF